MKLRRAAKEGFIVHPFETGNSQYHAGYGRNLNKTTKSFKTLTKAKTYLKKHGMEKALYDAPQGAKTIDLKKKVRVVRRRQPQQFGMFPRFGGF